MHHQTLTSEFTRQAESFNRSSVANSTELIDQLVELAGPRPEERWLEAACGPGILSRALAPFVAEIHGVDTTPAMIEVARREAAALGRDNAHFEVGDATALAAEDGSFSGAVARFALHHIPGPGRLFEELARVVAPGGRVVLADHLADGELESYAWAQELERLRDPSHWASLTLTRLHALGRSARLELEREDVAAIELDFDDWLARGSGGTVNRALIDRLLRERPSGTESFALSTAGSRRRLRLQLWAASWRVP